ncbi:Right handed beta helix region [Spirosomataceae bacterium TFI 002]|nr:Right handed beta helix region [Spirosomataceae bacterium TFI 002]
MTNIKRTPNANSMLSILLLVLLFCTNLFAQKAAIHIATSGNDQNNGTENNPVASVERANQLVKEHITNRVSEDTIRVIFHEGTYRLSEGIILNAANSGTEHSPIIYQSKQGEKVIISGAIPIKGFGKLSKNHDLYRKSPEIASKIVEIDLTKTSLSIFDKIRLRGFSGSSAPAPYSFRELYLNGKPMPLSRWPNDGYSNFTHAVSDSSSKVIKTGIVYEDEHISSWKIEPNILLHGYWKYLWADAYEQVSEIDADQHTIWLTPPYNHYLFSENKPFAAYNVISEIDLPGEWAYDYQKKKIYFYPPEDTQNSSLELSICETPLLQINDAAWISIRGIQFQMGAENGLLIKDSQHINIIDCDINGFAGEGIMMLNGHKNTISSCRIYNMGRGGIVAKGGNRETLERSDYVIDNCHIHDLSRIDHTYTPGIWVDGVGTTIKHSKFHDIPSSAMRINGNDHIVEYNDISHVVTESDDQGAIDMWGDPTYRGNVFRCNYIYDIGPKNQGKIDTHAGRAGIRFDDAIAGCLVYSNIFKNCAGGAFGAIQIHGGNKNLIWNNLFYQNSGGISFTPWSKSHWANYTKKSMEFFDQHSFLYVSRYPELIEITENLNKNTVSQNLFINCAKTTLRMPEAVVMNNNLALTLTSKLEDNAYSLKSIEEELRKIKFQPIPFEKIGLQNE